MRRIPPKKVNLFELPPYVQCAVIGTGTGLGTGIGTKEGTITNLFSGADSQKVLQTSSEALP